MIFEYIIESKKNKLLSNENDYFKMRGEIEADNSFEALSKLSESVSGEDLVPNSCLPLSIIIRTKM